MSATATPRERHWMNRLSGGATPAQTLELRRAGGPAGWFERQLKPARIRDPFAAGLRAYYPNTRYAPPELWQRHKSGVAPLWIVAQDLQRWTLLRRIHSTRQLHEVMVDFWSNLLHVPSGDDKAWPWRWDYDATIRRHALGRFDQLLQATISHPAMGCYLDNAQSTHDRLNENLGRELLELHTVGRSARYTETDVLMSARILTGYRVDMWNTFTASYDPYDHWVGRVKVLGFSDTNTAADGRGTGRRYLRYLAHHPATARRVARRLCVRLVRDDPSPAMVSHVARAYLKSGTDITATLRAVVRHPDFDRSAGLKVRTPTEDAVAMFRSCGVLPRRPRDGQSHASAFLWMVQEMGSSPFDWPAPDGSPDVGEAWSGVSRVLRSFEAHHSTVAGWWPTQEASYRDEKDWLAGLRFPATLAEVTDHVARAILCRPAGEALKRAVAQRMDLPLSWRADSTADLPMWRLEDVLVTALNSPAHMVR